MNPGPSLQEVEKGVGETTPNATLQQLTTRINLH